MQLHEVILCQLSESTIERRGIEVLSSLYNIKIFLFRRAFCKCAKSIYLLTYITTSHIVRSRNHWISVKPTHLMDLWQFTVVSGNCRLHFNIFEIVNKDIYIFDCTHVTFQTLSENQVYILIGKIYKLLMFKLGIPAPLFQNYKFYLHKMNRR